LGGNSETWRKSSGENPVGKIGHAFSSQKKIGTGRKKNLGGERKIRSGKETDNDEREENSG
jgi:hypothetical protein